MTSAVCFEGLTISGVRLSKNVLGAGAYGTVVESDWHGTPCVTKQLHAVFPQCLPPDQLEPLAMSFCRECKTWASLRHPHIVQFLGVFFPSDPHSALPALVLEKMQQSLRHYLEQHDKVDFPLLGKVYVLHQVAQAVSYLHSRTPALVHHDLSPNNILINEVGFVAKLTDFGMTRVICANRITSVKGTQGFMPPEALQHPPRYDQQLDVFSFGTVIISILTHQWPEPGPPNINEGDALVAQTEFDRRKQYVKMFSEREQALFLNLVRGCLENRPEVRPRSSELVTEVKKVEELLVNESSQRPCHASEMQLVLAAREVELANSRRELTRTRHELTSMRHELDSVKQELEKFQLDHASANGSVGKPLDSKSSHGSTVTASEPEPSPECPPSLESPSNSQCRPSQVDISAKCQPNTDQPSTDRQPNTDDQPNTEHQPNTDQPNTDRPPNTDRQPNTDQLNTDQPSTDRQPNTDDQPNTEHQPNTDDQPNTSRQPILNCQPTPEPKPKLLPPHPVQTLKQLVWSQGPKPPMEMEFPIAAHVDHFIYVGDRGESRSHIYQLDIAAMTWAQIPMPNNRRRKGYCLVSTPGLLHLISGRCREAGRNIICNEVWTLSPSEHWEARLPPICNDSGVANAVAVSFGRYIVVAGGESMGKQLSTVKVINTRAKSPQWIEASPLPDGMSNAQAAVFNGHVLFGFGFGSADVLYQAPVEALKSLADDPSSHDHARCPLLWTALPPLPVTHPGVTVVRHCLLSIGGRSSDSRSFVYCYDTVSGQWVLTSEARRARSLLSAVTITRDTRELIFVFGGSTSTTPCEFAEIIF